MEMNEYEAVDKEGRKEREVKDNFIIILFLLAHLPLYRIKYAWIPSNVTEGHKL
jgi:hypothetical protein